METCHVRIWRFHSRKLRSYQHGEERIQHELKEGKGGFGARAKELH